MPARHLPPTALLSCLATLALAPSLLAEDSSKAAAKSPDVVEQAWVDSTLYLFNEAYSDLQEAEGREARLARAALLLLQQPKTESNLDSAVRELESLAGAAAPDDVSATARYLLGRVSHIHRTPPDLAAAAVHYRQLLAEQPAHLLADQALVKLALIELYDPALGQEARAARIDALADQADALARPASRRDLHLVLAEAVRHFDLGDERMLRHYLAADKAGVPRATLRANVTVAIGELAACVGRADLARTYFERFLAEFKRDYRRTLVRDKLAALPAIASVTPSR